jgi:uncharacterized membrane protein (DUF4010 family)
VLNAPLLPILLPYLAAPAIVAVLVAIAGARSAGASDVVQQPSGSRSPLELQAALQMALLFQVVLMLVHAARVWQGQAGVYTSAAVLGLTDVDALTLSMARDVASAISLQTAATAIAIGVLTNTLLKMGIALLFGSGAFRLIAAGTLAAMASAAAASLAWLR